MNRATLVIMAAGIGSRFGDRIKQLEPVGPGGECLMEYSIYDAVRAGFDKVIFVIRKELETEFKNGIGKRVEQVVQVGYALQELQNIPFAYRELYKNRKKPWGTGQAVLSCKDFLHEPFVVINADDYYGKQAYQDLYRYLMVTNRDTERLSVGMAGFVLKNTLSAYGGVTRGICKVDADHMLTEIRETKNIKKRKEGAVAFNSQEEIPLAADSLVSMNMWALPAEFPALLQERFERFLNDLGDEYMEAEFLLPNIIEDLLCERAADVRVIPTADRWFGVTYQEDRQAVADALQKLLENGSYPRHLFENNMEQTDEETFA